MYLQANGSLEEAVSLVLEQAQHQDTSATAVPAQSTFCVTLDAQFAAQVEDAFGNARKGENFPGLLQANIPASLARYFTSISHFRMPKIPIHLHMYMLILEG